MELPEPNLINAPRDRREFLKKSVAGAVLLGSAGFLAQCQRRVTPAPRPEGVTVFEAREFETLRAFCQTVLPAADTPAAQAVPYRIDREIGHWSAKNQAEVKSLLALLEGGTRYFLYGWRPFSGLSADEGQDYLHGWESSRFDFRRQAFQALRMMAFFYFYSQDETWKVIGYDGPWIK